MDVSLRRSGRRRRHRIGIVVAAFVASPAGAHSTAPPTGGDRARYILPPGNYGGLPTTAQSRDQLPLYDGLTPLRGNVTDADIDSHFIPEDFKPVGATHEEPTGRPGTKIVYDSYGVPHVSGKTRADLAFGAGWVTARDRGLLLQLGRGPGACRRRRRPGHQRVRARHERSDVRAERADRAAPHRPGEPHRQDLRRQGSRDDRRHAGGSRRHHRVLQGAQHQPAAGHGQRRHRGDRVHRLDLRGRRRRRGVERGVPLEAAGRARPGHRAQGVGGRDAVRRPRGADHHHAAVQLRDLHRRTGHGLRAIDAGSIVSLDPTRSTPRRHRGRRRSPTACSSPRRPTPATSPRTRPRDRCRPSRRRTSSSSTRPARRAPRPSRSWVRSSATTTRRSSSRSI